MTSQAVARLLFVPLSILLIGAGKGKPYPDGRIAFSKDVGGTTEIFVMVAGRRPAGLSGRGL